VDGLSEGVAIGVAAAAVIGAAAATWTYASLSPGSQMFGHTLVAGRNPDEVALTFDDGPNDNATSALLDILAEYDARATFFMIGGFVRQRPELARRVQAAGHLIGNHTQTHPWLHRKPARVIREELRVCNESLEDVLGQPVKYFRPPHGARRPAVLQIARELGLTTVQWTVMGEDWKKIGLEGILANVNKGMRKCRRAGTGANVLLHDGHDRRMGSDRVDTLRVTAAVLERLPRKGMHAVTVDAWG
jgi:peptidoglycan/xylan/chitin deacetylase (PgdA/CDA1 family)